MKHAYRLNILVMTAVLVGSATPCCGTESIASVQGTSGQAAVEKRGTEKGATCAGETSDGAKPKPQPKIEGIELGKFSVRTHRAVPAQMNRVSFTLYARVSAEEAKHFAQLLDHRENKVREQVIVATRLVPVEEFDDAEFTKFRRRILLRLRRSLSELTMDDVYVSDFELVVENN